MFLAFVYKRFRSLVLETHPKNKTRFIRHRKGSTLKGGVETTRFRIHRTPRLRREVAGDCLSVSGPKFRS